MFLDAIAEEDGGVEGSRAVARRADDLVRRCYSGLRGPAFQVEVVRAIHALLPVDAVFLATADPGTLLLTGIFAEEPLVGVADQFLDNEFGQDDVNKFQSLATVPRHVATLDSATHGGRAGSARYRDIMAPALVMSCGPPWLPRPGVGVTCACTGRVAVRLHASRSAHGRPASGQPR
jgi:hypothetical protein